MHKKKPLVLMILDGWGYRQDSTHNAIAHAKTPQWDAWWATRPHTLLQASGLSVGLPDEQMGNSEVGHMHLGAGRIIPQELTRIHHAMKNHEFEHCLPLKEAFHDMQQTHSALHIMGLFSPGGVHSHEDHLFALLDVCQQQHVSHVYLHLFLDGRDTPPQSAQHSLERLEAYLNKTSAATLCSISGRYHAMDRDRRWERIEPVYHLLVQGTSAHHATHAIDALKTYYAQGINDEFIPPTQLGTPHPIQDGDHVLFFNFRADRARQLTEAFVSHDFKEFKRQTVPKLKSFISMTSYADYLDTKCLFPPTCLHQTMGEVIANHGLHQLRLAETEKYAHVTFFFNGGSEHAFQHEDRQLIPSPKVATYDLAPEMSAPQLTQALIDALHQDRYDVIICNYANADMVGHTGDFHATMKAIETLDQAMHDIWQALSPLHGRLFITADHGNAETMFDENIHQAHTAHTHQPVPFLYVGDDDYIFDKHEGTLSDVAPTLLTVLGIQPPAEMTGHMLMVKAHE